MKKKYWFSLFKGTILKKNRAMKLTFILFIVALLNVQANSYSQNKKLSINVNNETVKTVLDKIEAQSRFNFFYKTDKVDVKRKVSLNVDKVSIRDILNSIFKNQNVSFSLVKKQIVLRHNVKLNEANLLEGTTEVLQNEIKGTVVDSNGEPLPGANIVEKGTLNGVTVDFDGNFSLKIADENAVLLITYIGYSTVEIPVNGQTTINIVLKESAAGLDEVVVIGYGSVKKSDLTGAVASVKLDELSRGVTTSVDQMLNGVTGANVVQNNGAPGAGFSINVRGASSVSAGNEPLYVIDGFPVNNSPAIGSGSITGFSASRSPTNPMSSINPQDIESIEILKDASAAAIYGSRGANGVVLITTKKGKKGSLKTDYQYSVGIQKIFNSLDLLSAVDYKRVLNEIIEDGGGSNGDIVEDIANNGNGINWQDQIGNSSAVTQNHQLSFSGGSDITNYFVSLNSVNQEGIVKASDFKRYSLRLNLESQLSDKFKLGVNATTSYSESTFIPNGFGTNESSGVVYSAINFDPTLGIKGENGDFIISPLLSIDNPLALIKGTSSASRTSRILTSVYGEYEFVPDLKGKISVGGDIVNEKRENYISRVTKNGFNTGGTASNQQGELSSYIVEGTLNYSKTFGAHTINALGGLSFQKFSSSRINIGANNFPSDALNANNLSLGSQETFNISNPTTGNSLASVIGRLDYALLNKYSTTLTVRRDGSSRFGENSRYGVFPSAALAWKISEENFLKDSKGINFLKLRASWGLTGNQEIGNFAYQTTYSGANPAIWDGNPTTSTAPTRLPNPDLKWEQTEQLNFGLDFGFLGNRINGNLDYFTKTTTDMLLQLPVPQSSGFNTVLTNIGEIDNSGFELSINSKNIVTSDFKWDMSISLTTLKNEVIDLGGIPEINSGGGFLHVDQVGVIRPGAPLNSFYGWEVDGIWQEGDDLSVTNENVSPGNIKYVDQDGDGFVNGDDRVILGNSFPDFQWSLGNTFTYKNFDLFIFFDGVEGAEMLNGNLIESYFPINFRRNKFAEPYLNRWTPENPSNIYPSFVTPLSQGRKTVNSITVQDASYLRLKNVRLSYSFSKMIRGIQSAKIFIAAENLFLKTEYDGFDPSINPNNNASLRVDLNSYPTARTYMLGFVVSL
ncbi:TonB-dependent receptor [Maribacter sp. ACAM166]|uniref:TonB-dependent receptor n=1 Tax=Maribacter sp. ACAM166 TaxID=2508996 RepID=UPI0010FE1BDE|nr:TonB-dependent receptor [Maribacter sp. ACAM166]TLP71843.1 TonB-dependent receptor [Maribacter sp. ACAM166]